jgi:RNA polymerase sigma-70 factor (ECF subfamily)
MSSTHERAMIEACLNGDQKAHKQLYDKHVRTMFGICLRYCGSYDEAKDVLQEGFIKVFTKLSQFSHNGSFEGWMKRIFVNTALEHYRNQKKLMNESDIEAADENPHNDYTLEKITQKEILQVMNQMAPGYRTVLNLYIIEGYSHAEIAEMLGISENTSKSQLSRARVILQQELLKLKNYLNENR